MTSSTIECDLSWDDLVLNEAEVITLHLQARTSGNRIVDITYDHGSVLVTTSGPNTQTPAIRVLDLREVSELLAVLRKLAQKTPRLRSVNSSALHSFVGALATLVHSPGQIPFSTAYFANIRRTDDGDLDGQLALGSRVVATIYDDSGQLYFEQHAEGNPKGQRRLLSIAQLRALIAALQLRTSVANPALDPLWQQVLADAITKDDNLRKSGL